MNFVHTYMAHRGPSSTRGTRAWIFAEIEAEYWYQVEILTAEDQVVASAFVPGIRHAVDLAKQFKAPDRSCIRLYLRDPAQLPRGYLFETIEDATVERDGTTHLVLESGMRATHTKAGWRLITMNAADPECGELCSSRVSYSAKNP